MLGSPAAPPLETSTEAEKRPVEESSLVRPHAGLEQCQKDSGSIRLEVELKHSKAEATWLSP